MPAIALPAYAWSGEIPGQAVAYGIPGTDDRPLRIGCLHGKLSIGGPVDAELGQRVVVTVTGRGGPRKYQSEASAQGDEVAFSIPVQPGDDALDTLMAGGAIRIAATDHSYIVSGKGAAVVLGPLIQACRAG